MPYNFSTLAHTSEFIAKELDNTASLANPLPNLKWISEGEMAETLRSVYRPRAIFQRVFGGVFKNDNIKQLPKGWVQTKSLRERAQCLLLTDMKGLVFLGESKQGKLWFGKFAFCRHKTFLSKKLDRHTTEYRCKSCKYSYTLDSGV